MKISVSLPEEDIEFLDEYAKSQRIRSRSAVIQRALRMLRSRKLGSAYAGAWEEWETCGDAEAWDSVVGDGLETSHR